MESGKEVDGVIRANPEALIDGLDHLAFGMRLRAVRRLLGMSLDEMAGKLCVSKQFLSTIERGEQKSVMKVLARMKDIFGANLDTLYESVKSQKKE